MNRALYFILAVTLAFLGVGAYFKYAPGHSPAGQPPLANFEPQSFQQQFNAAASQTRILALLSPT